MKLKYLSTFTLATLFSLGLSAQAPLWTQIANPAGLTVNGVSFSADGSEVLSGTNCHPSYLRLYDVTNGSITWDYQVGQNLMCLMGVGISANGNYLAAVEEMGNVLVFDYTQSPPDSITTIPMGTTYAFSIAFSPASDKVAVGGSSGWLKTYNIPSGTLDKTISAHLGWVTAVAYSPDGQWIASGGADNKIKLWTTTGTVLRQFLGHTDDITNVRFTPDSQRIISSAKDNTVRVWDATTGSLLHTFATGTSDVNGIALSPDGQHVASVSNDLMIRFWNTTTYAFEGDILQPESATPLCIDWSPDGQKIITGTSAGKVTLFLVPALVGAAEPSTGSGLSVYPNPFQSQVRVRLAEGHVAGYTLRDAAGRLVAAGEGSGSEFQLDLAEEAHAAGYYLLEVTSDAGLRYRQPLVRQ